MPDPADLELRLNPLFSRWVDAWTGPDPLFATLRLHGLSEGEERVLCAGATAEGLEVLAPPDGASLRVSGPGARFKAWFARVADADLPAGTRGVLEEAFANRAGFGAGTYALAPGLALAPGVVQLWGIVNVTPDSFSDGGRFFSPGDAVAQGVRLAEEGADVVDVGGESTRPGSDPVGAAEELDRVIPVIEGIRSRSPVAISVDTAKAAVARAAVAAGARVVNDVTALTGDPGMAAAVAESGAGAALMHMRGTPRTMQADPRYGDLWAEVAGVLRRALRLLAAAGGAPALVDPGIGFGKTVAHNLSLIRECSILGSLGRPVLLGPSRKSFLGAILDLPVGERLEGTASAVAAGVLAGARAVRVHDVREMGRVARVAAAVAAAGEGP